MNLFFSSDDWFHLRIANIDSSQEFINFFSFSPNPQTASFYRPLSTQVFFFLFEKLFGLNPTPYYLFGLFLFGLSLFLLYRLIRQITNSQKLSILTLFFYAFSVTNVTRLIFISAYQELFLVNFILIALLTSSKRPVISLVSFILALLSKETAVILPALIMLVDWYHQKVNLKRILPYIAFLLPYLFLRLLVFKGGGGDSYIWDFSPFRVLNTLFWYSLWSLGAPELLVDYVGSGLRILPRFFIDFPFWSSLILALLGASIVNLILLLLKHMKQIKKSLIFGIGFFILSLLPVLFLPWHKFALELTVPLIGSCFILSRLTQVKSLPVKTFIALYLTLNISMYYLTYTRNYAVNRGVISQKVFNFLRENYPHPPSGYFEFVNDTPDYGSDWGSSKQISYAISGSELFRVFYSDPGYTVYFADFPGQRPETTSIPLSTDRFVSTKIE